MSDETKLILSARRPGGQDDADPAIAEALARAKSDPALSAWVEEQQRTDAALALKLLSVQPPAGLRDTILAGGKVSRRGWFGWFDQKAWRNFTNSEVIAAVAVVLVLAVAIIFGRNEPRDWRNAGALEVARIESSQRQLDHMVGDMSEIRRWLASQTCPAPATLPVQVRGLPIYGCAKMNWRGLPMSIVCFDLGGGRKIHLVTIELQHLAAPPPEDIPEYAAINGYMTASWSEGEVAMMLIGKVGREDLEKLFATSAKAAFQIHEHSFKLFAAR